MITGKVDYSRTLDDIIDDSDLIDDEIEIDGLNIKQLWQKHLYGDLDTARQKRAEGRLSR